MIYLFVLIIGFVIIWFAINIKEEVLRISAAIMGSLTIIWGFTLSPTAFQIAIELVGVISVFTFCMRCWAKD
ncbi:hypothetical protein NIES267_59050 [Calothrix parasitica NIES-267]|uniref:Uncharacterized protein n=1 Tax=Calothrix parasitica NIES-267 TaxID=1973488 RepID=A0A1Z4LZ48_9CYAN|nr:hypothetical protein NIES267_59050 [Calothrix parasitica NIES-267]